MQQTTNLKLKKPDTGDPVKISDLNGNMDILDAAITGKLDKTGNAASANKATNDGSNRNIVNTYATKSELNGIAPTVSFNKSNKILTVTVNGKSDTATIDAGGGDITVINHW